MLYMVYMFIFGAFGTLIATFLGGFFSKLISNKRKEILNFFQNFSVGGIIALLFFELIIEAIEHYQTGINNDALGALYTLLIIAGVGLLFFFMHIVFDASSPCVNNLQKGVTNGRNSFPQRGAASTGAA